MSQPTHRRADRVVTRAPMPLLLVGAPAALAIWVGLLAAVRLAVIERDWLAPFRDSGIGPVGATIGWAIVAVLLVVLPASVAYVTSYRQVLDASGLSLRLGRRTTHTAAADVTAVTYVPASTPTSRQRPDRVFVTARGQAKPIARVTIYDRDWGRALRILGAWVEERPDLATDQRTRDLLTPTATAPER